MNRIAASLAIPAALCFPLGAQAQTTVQTTVRVVATCGSGVTWTAGKMNFPTVDTTGTLCVSSGGSSGGNVNLTGINGVAPSITNPLFIANAEAADTTGTFTNATQTTSVTNSSADGYASGLVSINGTYGTASGVFEISDDGGTTWYAVVCARSDGSALETGYTSLTNTNRQWTCPVAGNDSLRVRSTAVASGTVNVRVGISAPPPSGDPAATVTTSGALQPPTAASGKLTLTDVSITATTNTQIAAANANRIGLEVQCSAGPTKLSTVGGTLTSATPGTGPAGIILPTASTLYIPAMASLTAVTVFGPSGVCTVAEYVR